MTRTVSTSSAPTNTSSADSRTTAASASSARDSRARHVRYAIM
ncbi:hypothetical protein AB0K14_23625 [Actinosynnema sp. NPDC050801]